MPNNIELFKQYLPLLDEVYQTSSLTSVLDGASALASQGANANELIIQKMSMDGLADYSRNGGYVAGSVTLTNETVKCNFDRGRMFQIDNMDNAEFTQLYESVKDVIWRMIGNKVQMEEFEKVLSNF